MSKVGMEYLSSKIDVVADKLGKGRSFMVWPIAIFKFLASVLRKLDKKIDGSLSFFFKHYGKTRFMMAMSKKLQVLGLEKLFLQGPKAFIYFFLFYLVRDTILYIILPIYFAKWWQ